MLVITFTYKSNMHLLSFYFLQKMFLIKIACSSMISSIHHSGTLHYMSLMCYLYYIKCQCVGYYRVTEGRPDGSFCAGMMVS